MAWLAMGKERGLEAGVQPPLQCQLLLPQSTSKNSGFAHDHKVLYLLSETI